MPEDKQEVSPTLKVSNHLGTKRSISHEHQKSSGLSPDFQPAAHEDIPFLFASWYSPLEE